MSGSITRRGYTSDSNVLYSIKIDESNARGVVGAGTASLCPALSANSPGVPAGFSKRYVLAYSANTPTKRRKFFIGDKTLIPLLTVPGAIINAESSPGPGDTAGTSISWVVTAYRGEKQAVEPAAGSPDTGLTDGTP